MKRNAYAIRVEAGRIIAAEVDDATAALLFNEGVTVLILSQPELEQLARRQYRMLVALPRGSVTCFRVRRGPIGDRLRRAERFVVPASRPRLLESQAAARLAAFVHQV
jgi:hypothetical protein